MQDENNKSEKKVLAGETICFPTKPDIRVMSQKSSDEKDVRTGKGNKTHPDIRPREETPKTNDSGSNKDDKK